MRNNRSATTIEVARAVPALALICNWTVVVPPVGMMLFTLTHGWNDVAVTGQPLGVVTVMFAIPPAAAVFERSSGDSEYVHDDSGR